MATEKQHPLVGTDWLAGNLGLQELVVLDASFFLPNQNRDAQAEYQPEPGGAQNECAIGHPCWCLRSMQGRGPRAVWHGPLSAQRLEFIALRVHISPHVGSEGPESRIPVQWQPQGIVPNGVPPICVES